MNALGKVIVLTFAVVFAGSPVFPAPQVSELSSLGHRPTAVVAPRTTTDPKLDPLDGDIDLSPDGRLFVYEYRPHPIAMKRVLRMASTATGKVLTDSLLAAQGFEFPGHPKFSPDGTQVALSGPTGPMVVGVNGEELRKLVGEGWDYGAPSWRPDGKALVVDRRPSERNHPAALDEVVCLDAATGKVLWKLKRTLFSCRLSPDGKWLIGVCGNELLALELGTGTTHTLWDSARFTPPGNYEWPLDHKWDVAYGLWSWDSRTVLMTVKYRDWNLPQGPVTSEIWPASLQGGEAQKIADGTVLAGTADGKRLLVDWRTAALKLERKKAGQPELQPGDLSVLTAEGGPPIGTSPDKGIVASEAGPSATTPVPSAAP